MTKCIHCNITISDDTIVCPLCKCVAEGVSETDKLNEYPEVRIKQRKMKLLSNLVLIAILITGLVLIGLNLAVSEGSWWCLIPVAAMTYAYLAFRMIFVSERGYRSKVFVPMALALVLLLIIDMETGAHGWCLNYVLPSVIMVADIIILMLMLTNLKNWHSYMIMQITVMAVCIIPLILCLTGIISSPLLTLIAAGVSLSMFLGTLVIGGRTARRELKIRFHIR